MPFNTDPVTTAIIPSFLRFGVIDVEHSMGPVHGNYGVISRDITASLKADPGQTITGPEGQLENCNGHLMLYECHEISCDWTGSIERMCPFTDPATGYRLADYHVKIALRPDIFDRLLAIFSAGQNMFGLSLDFQNIDWPDDAEPVAVGELWDDVRFPHVALTSFLLRWKPLSGRALPNYSWPRKHHSLDSAANLRDGWQIRQNLG